MGLLIFLVIGTGLTATLWLAHREWRFRTVAPAVARGLNGQGQSQRAIRYAERHLANWCLTGESGRRELRAALATLYLGARRYDDARAQCEIVLSNSLPAWTEASFRQRLADSLDGLGEFTPAREQRDLAVSLLETHEKPSGNATSRALLLAERARIGARTNRFGAAADTFAEALTVLPTSATQRPQLLLEHALASFQAGRAAQTLESAEAALAETLPANLRLTAHSLASMAHANRGRYDDALRHRHDALDEARSLGIDDKIAEAEVRLAGLELQRGHLNEAMALATTAMERSESTRREGLLVQAEILEAWGRFDDAIATIDRADRLVGMGTPRIDARSAAVRCLARAQYFCRKSDPDAARTQLTRVGDAFRDDIRMRAWVASVELWIAALDFGNDINDASETFARATAALNDAEAKLEATDSLRRLLRMRRAQAITALAALAPGDIRRTALRDQALALWSSWRDDLAVPLHVPESWVAAADCLADRPGDARVALENALACGIDDHFTADARRRLTN